MAEAIKSSIQTHNFTIMKDLQPIHFQIIQMQGSFWLWVGDSRKSFEGFAVSSMTKYDKVPTAINLLGDASDFTSQILAKKLAKKTGKQVFVSYNLSEDSELRSFAETSLFKKLKDNPEIF